MKIQFCDLCNESVPQTDLESGQAFMRSGRVICASCDQAMSLGKVPPIPPAGGGLAPTQRGPETSQTSPQVVQVRHVQSGAGLAWVALLGVIAVGLWRHEALSQEHDFQLAQSAHLRDALDETEREVNDLRSRMESQAGILQQQLAREVGEQKAGLLAAQQEIQKETADLARDLGGLRGGLDALGGLSERIDSNAQAASKADQALGELVAGFDALTARISSLETASSAAAAIAEQQDAVPQGPPWAGLLPDLQDANSGTRWTAVTALGETGDVAVAEHLVPLLRDDDIFVRMATARVLGDLSAAAGIEPLIDALEDPEEPVREAAMVALRQITGKNFHFDPHADEADRMRRIRAWKEWWRQAREDYLGASE